MTDHYFLAVSLGAAVVAGALLGVVAAYFICMWRENRR